ncbi:hypothetical protein HYW42_05080 [Candidatus Daviesbacteria bacterium]|nr:hypothetical protein [Candidatus Daviesbacteria bacterium]
MDPNQADTNQNQTTGVNSTPTQQNQNPNTPISTQSGKSNKLPIILAILVLILVLGAGGYYLLASSLSSSKSQSYKRPATQQPESVLSTVQAELNSIEVEASDSGFSDIDQDLNSL